MVKTWFFGELLARLACENYERIEQAGRFTVRYTGAEANAAIAMQAVGGRDVEILSAVPDDALGRACLGGIRRYGPSVDHVVRAPGRLGTFYLETGAHLRPSVCIYDRRDSVFARTPFEAYGAETLFTGGGWLHVSGTAPAVSPVARVSTRKMLTAAKSAGFVTSFDLNYRSRLWDENEAGSAFRELMPFVDVLIANEGVAEHFLGTRADDLCRTFGLRVAALTRRRDISASRTAFGALLLRSDGNRAEVPELEFDVVDRVGGGDAFAGAVILALQREEMDDVERIRFAHACGVLKHETPGDFSLTTEDEIHAFLNGRAAAVRR